jgi:hypothetical protein
LSSQIFLFSFTGINSAKGLGLPVLVKRLKVGRQEAGLLSQAKRHYMVALKAWRLKVIYGTATIYGKKFHSDFDYYL